MYRLIIILVFFSCAGYSQGLNAELGFNDNYDQTSKALVCVDEFTYFARFQKTSSFFSTCELYKIDTVGNILWNAHIYPLLFPPAQEFTDVFELIASEDGGVYVLGFGMPTCDVPQNCFWFIQKYDSVGNLEWTKPWINFIYSNATSLTGLFLNENNELLVNYVDSSSSSYVYTIDNSGLTIDSIPVAHGQLNGFCELTGYEFIAYKGDSLFAFDTNGTNISGTEFTSSIQSIQTLNDSLYVLTLDSIFIYDNNLNLLQGSDVPGYSLYSKIKVSANKIQFVSSGIGNQTILELDKQLQLQNTIIMPVAVNTNEHKDFNNSHFSVAYDFPITLHRVVRYLDYSLNSTQNISGDNTDIGIIDLNVTQTYVNPQPSFGVYSIGIWADALVKNYGNKVLNSCRINHRISIWMGICSEIFYTTEFTNLNLAPNDSLWITLGAVHNSVDYFSGIIDVDLCVYTSHPNFVTDTIVPNDQFCENVILGYVGGSENVLQSISVSPNPFNDIIQIENPELKDLSLFIYDGAGKVIAVDSGSNNRFSFNLARQREGLYLVRVVSNEGEVTKKIIKN